MTTDKSTAAPHHGAARQEQPTGPGDRVPPPGPRTPVKKIAFFAHDSGESTVIKRATAFQATGASVIGFMFRRDRGTARPAPVWTNVALGATVDRNYLARLPKLAAGLWTTLRHRGALSDCDVIYARNFDMMAIATAAKWLSRSPARLVYEVLDVQRAFVGTGPVNAFFRWCERRLLSACDMLVVSSPMFMKKYFEPRQGYTGAWYLLENKVSASALATIPAATGRTPAAGPPWVIGWFGTLRCPRSLDILSRLASAYPDTVSVHIRGTPSEEDIPKETLLAATNGRPNVQYLGPYQSPRDLPDIYSQIHFSWAIDFLDADSNSDWLLPNRVYEGGLFDAISIARDGTATGDMVVREGLGVTLREPIDESLSNWLQAMDADRFAALHDSSSRAPRMLFVDETDTAALLEAIAATATRDR